MQTHSLKLCGEISKKTGVTIIELHATASGMRSVVRYPFDGRRYEILVNPLSDEDPENK